MARTTAKADDSKPASKRKDDGAEAEATKKKPRQQDGTRETIESIVVAFVLAFLFRAFEAEMFVIPTGSMAPTLFGRHKDADCEACGYHFQFGASDEIDDESGGFNPMRRIDSAICPNCRFENEVRDLPAHNGDRIMVNKWPYEIGEPQRWDVPVFKYPEKPMTNYIKRLVGLPSETIHIKRGDLYLIGPDGAASILRKSPNKQKLLQIPVYDNDHPETPLHQRGWPKRWAPVEKLGAEDAARRTALELGPVAGWTESSTGWQEEPEQHAFRLDAGNATDDLKWVRYRHIIPGRDDWEAASEGAMHASDPEIMFSETESLRPRAQLVSDFCGYNTYRGGHGNVEDDPFWTTDLTVSATVEVLSVDSNASVVFELNDGLRQFRCHLDPANGNARITARLWYSGTESEEVAIAEASTSFSGTGTRHVRFANVDDRLCLWIDDGLVELGEKASYTTDESHLISATDADLTPVGIAARGAAIRVSELLIERDIYYRANQINEDGLDTSEHPDPSQLRRNLHNPAKWNEIYNSQPKSRREATFTLGEDEFLMLGDNSPRSADSRIWSNLRGAAHRHAVPRSALVGKAFWIYWPHGIPFLGEDGHGYPLTYHDEDKKYPSFRVPFYPNFWRMKRIR